MTQWTPEGETPKTSALIPWKGTENAPSRSPRSQQHPKSFFYFVAYFWRLLKGYTANDIDRLKEAGVRLVEGKAEKEHAEATAKIATAAREHGEAERARAEAEKLRAEADLLRAKSDADSLLSQVEAFERVETAISKIKQRGGDVAFSKAEILRLVWRESERMPDDPEVRQATREIEEEL
jgi:hypothetical protein